MISKGAHEEKTMQERERFARAARVIRQLMRHGDLSETELNDALWELIQRKTQEKKRPTDDSTPEGSASP